MTPEAEYQFWADRLGYEKTRGGRLRVCEKMPMVSPHLRRSPVVGILAQGQHGEG